MIFSVYEIMLLFFIYSFLGWCVEVAFVAVTTGKVVDRGFLNGPVCPIYGCGMVGVLIILLPVKNNVWLLFLGGMIICSTVELFGGWILDKIFHMRWWDYSEKPFNIGGYICLPFSIMWGICCCICGEIRTHTNYVFSKKSARHGQTCFNYFLRDYFYSGYDCYIEKSYWNQEESWTARFNCRGVKQYWKSDKRWCGKFSN